MEIVEFFQNPTVAIIIQLIIKIGILTCSLIFLKRNVQALTTYQTEKEKSRIAWDIVLWVAFFVWFSITTFTNFLLGIVLLTFDSIL